MEIDDHKKTISEAEPMELMALAKGFNTQSFVDTMMEQGHSDEDIVDFFRHLVLTCLEKDVLLRRDGYMDMIAFAGHEGFLG